jgi:hypothetical protein
MYDSFMEEKRGNTDGWWPTHWNPASKLYAEMKLAIVIPVSFMLWMILSRIIATIRMLDQLFQHSNLQLNPLHPDRCGGLGPLNRYAQTLISFIAVIGLGLVVIAVPRILTENYTQQPMLQIAIISYLVLAPYCFFGTLGTAHRAMLRARDGLLLRISDEFLVRYRETLKGLKENGEISEAQLASLQRFSRLHEITEAFPVWPFDAASIRRFAAAFVAPALGVPLATIATNLAQPCGIDLEIGVSRSAYRLTLRRLP